MKIKYSCIVVDCCMYCSRSRCMFCRTRLDISALRLSEGESGAALTGSMVKLEVAEETRDLPERFGFAHAYCEREKVII